MTGNERKTLDELQTDLEDQRELAQNRMSELDKLSTNYKDCLQQVEKLKMELSTLPEYVVVETTEHKCLQSQFSVLYNEAMQLKTQLEETRAHLQVPATARRKSYFHKSYFYKPRCRSARMRTCARSSRWRARSCWRKRSCAPR